MADIDRAFGRRAFGGDPANYDASRPAYPDWVFERLVERCGLKPKAAVFEVGAGTGTATRRLLAQGADPLVAVEPDARLAGFLAANRDGPLSILNQAFEEAQFPRADFDLGVCATAFHWLDEQKALAKVAGLLKPGGWWAMVWNVFGDPDRDDAFHDATFELLNDGPRSPGNGGPGGVPFALQVNDRKSAFGRRPEFTDLAHERQSWDLILNPDQVVALYATYSDMTARPEAEQRQVLAELRRIAADQFDGRVVRNMVTILYTARRR
jgi:SAM-dependent methyltransferase